MSALFIEMVSRDEPHFADFDRKVFGSMMEWALGEISNIIKGSRTAEQNLNLLRDGQLSLLFDENGDFIAEDISRNGH